MGTRGAPRRPPLGSSPSLLGLGLTLALTLTLIAPVATVRDGPRGRPQVVSVSVPATVMLVPRSEAAPLASRLWLLGDRLPAALPRLGRVAVVSVAVGAGFMLAMSYLRRITLRALLSYQGWLYEGPKDKNITTLVWGFLVKMVSGQLPLSLGAPKPLLYSNQGSLPRLPVPSLDDTCRRFLLSVRPILNDEDFGAFEKLVADFRKKEGPRLQLYLNFKSWFTANYVTDWWEKYVYLRGRSPILINSNYYVLDSKAPQARRRRRAGARSRWRTRSDGLLALAGEVPLCVYVFRRAGRHRPSFRPAARHTSRPLCSISRRSWTTRPSSP